MRLFLLLLFFPFLSQSQDLVNAVALQNGGRLLSSPPSLKVSSPHTAKIDDYSIQALTDESPILWCSKQNSSFPMTFVYELSEEFNLEKFVFNNICEKYTGICTRKIRIEVSATSPGAGFQLAGEYNLSEHKVETFRVTPVKARWIKLTILSNYGNKEYTELAEFEAWGKFSDPDYEETDIIGVWDTNFEWVSINNNKNGYIYGCYKWANGVLFSGEVNRRVFAFRWSEDNGSRKGWATIVINKEGNRLNGIWGFNNDRSKFGYWEFSKNSSTPKACWNDKEVENMTSTRVDQKPPKETLNIAFTFLDKETNAPVPAEVKVEYQGAVIAAFKADVNGFTRISLNKTYTYTVRVQAPSYMPQSFKLAFSEQEQLSGKDILKTIFLQKVETGKTLVLQNILFERSKYELLPESFDELDKLVELMQSNPAMEIELAGHTDNVGDPQKNIELSENRVNSVKTYLIRKGIAASRIKSVGYGGSKPLFSNDQESTRKLNRRVEFKVLKM